VPKNGFFYDFFGGLRSSEHNIYVQNFKGGQFAGDRTRLLAFANDG